MIETKRDVTVGLIAGRHALPVDAYILTEVTDPLDIDALRVRVWDRLYELVNVDTTFGTGVNQIDYTDIEVYTGDAHLTVFVTGLTVVVAEVIRFCAKRGVKLTLMHFDRETGSYIAQRIF